MAPKSRSERGCRCAADIYDGCRNNRADRPLTAFTNCPIKSPLHSGLFHYFPNPRFCRLTSDSQKNDVKKLCQKRCRNFGRNFAAKPPREQSSREGARADARRNEHSASGGADSSAPNAMRGCDEAPQSVLTHSVRSGTLRGPRSVLFSARARERTTSYATEVRDTQKGRKVRP